MEDIGLLLRNSVSLVYHFFLRWLSCTHCIFFYLIWFDVSCTQKGIMLHSVTWLVTWPVTWKITRNEDSIFDYWNPNREDYKKRHHSFIFSKFLCSASTWFIVLRDHLLIPSSSFSLPGIGSMIFVFSQNQNCWQDTVYQNSTFNTQYLLKCENCY